ncbi:hypothetical protein RB195_003373 [Necator americanus]|uniref:F-box domain-containing protein n=2 Tax=Necator americanus TaxID=51031 RepID=A0ABR1DN99_NECAM
MNRSRLLWRVTKKKILECQHRLKSLMKKAPKTAPAVVLDDLVMEEVLKHLDLTDRVKMRGVSRHIQALVDRMPLVLPFIFIRSDARGNIELHCDYMDVLAGYVLADLPGFKIVDDAITFNYTNARSVMTALVSRITGVTHLWLDSPWNGHIIQTIVEYYQAINSGSNRMRFHLEELTVVGSIRASDADWISSLILLSRRTISSLRFRHCRLHTHQQTVQLWSAVSQCQALSRLQYEPCRLDKWSRPHLIEALDKKPLESLILTGIYDLQPSDLFRMSSGGRLVELAVVGEQIKPTIFSSKDAKTMVEKLENLLIQVDSTFSIDDLPDRSALLRVLTTMPEVGVLEVIHICHGTVADTAKVIGYWIQLASDSSREIKLKLEECSQERADAAVGRLLRKVRGIGHSGWTKGGVAMQMGEGRLTVLDKRAWFGDE